jgi:hypothetical protein
MLAKPHQPARIAFDYLDRIIVGTVVDYDNLEIAVMRRLGCRQAGSYGGPAVAVGDDDRDEVFHCPMLANIWCGRSLACPVPRPVVRAERQRVVPAVIARIKKNNSLISSIMVD